MRPPSPTLAALLLTGCTGATPTLMVPDGIVSETWSPTAASDPLPVDADFWHRFGDDVLARVVASARAANPGVAAARARVAQARGLARVAGAALLPTVGANAGATATRTDNTGAARFGYSVGQAGIDIAYDVDLFGGLKAGRRAARARVAAAAFDADAAALVVETEAARVLVQWAALGNRIGLAERNRARARELTRVLTVRLREGEATRVDLSRQAIEEERLAAQAAALIEQQERLSAALAVLLGREAAGFTPERVAFDTLAPPAIDPGQPGALMVRRPDVRAAEARIAAARGDVAAARAAFLPSLRLTGSGLVQAAALGGPFGVTLAAGAGLLAPIFQGGRLRGQYEVASATQVESVALYRDVLLRAVAEGEQALAGVRGAATRQQSTARAVREAAAASRVARTQYLEGEIPLDVLIDIERTQNQVSDDAVLARQDRLLAAIDLYKALGGAPQLPTG